MLNIIILVLSGRFWSFLRRILRRFFEVLIRNLSVVLGRDRHRVAEPVGDDVSGVIRQQADDHQQAVAFKKELNTLELEHERAKNAEQAAYLKAMRDVDVDLTHYLVAQYQHPDRLIRIDSNTHDQPAVHLHE